MSFRTTWAYEEDKKLIDLRAAGVHHDQIGPRLGRTAVSCKARLQWHGASTVRDAQRVAKENKYGHRFGKDAGNTVRVDPVLCPSIISAWDAHIEALSRRSLTATLCGDPAAGRSALDQKLLQRPRVTLPTIAAVVVR